MRPIGQLETEEQARLFADYLFVRELEAQVEASSSGGWTIWVVDEERVDEGKGLLSRFRSMPDAEEFYQASEAAEKRRRGERKEAREIEKKLKRPGAFPWMMPGGGLTLVLVLLSAAVYLLTREPANASWIGTLQISALKLKQGQIWRLWTPIFIHYDIWHLIFNLWWLRDLGRILESRMGTGRFAIGVALIALISNGAQYMVAGGSFGGMSGVVYGLFGYLWVRGKYDRAYMDILAPMTVTILFVYLGLGVFGIFPHVANTAHITGLLTGSAMGWVASRRRN